MHLRSLSGVSSLALAIAAPAALAADLTPGPAAIVPAPPLPPTPWTWWLEGGAQGLAGGDSNISGSTPAFATPSKRWGWAAAAGVDYRFDPFWHVSADFRYGQNNKRTSSSNPFAVFGIPTPSHSGTVSSVIRGVNSANRDEQNWEADFMVGRDIGLGGGQAQLKFGVRVAEIRGKTTGSAAWNNIPTCASCSTPNTTSHRLGYQQTNRFLGAGPRVALEGTAPIGGPWFVDYMGGAAALYGARNLNQTVSATGGGTCLASCSANFASTDHDVVFNADGMLGLGYAFTANVKLSLNYRVDAYFDALKVVNASNNVSNVDRIYHGPNLRLTIDY